MTVEYSFGIATLKWRVSNKPIGTGMKKVFKIA